MHCLLTHTILGSSNFLCIINCKLILNHCLHTISIFYGGEKSLTCRAFSFINSNIINKVFNISLIIVWVLSILVVKCQRFKTLSHIKHFIMSQNRALNEALSVFLYIWVQVQNKTLWTAPLWTYGAVWTTASFEVNGKSLSELNFVFVSRENANIFERERKSCHGTQISLRENAKYLQGDAKFLEETKVLRENAKHLRNIFSSHTNFSQHHVALGAL